MSHSPASLLQERRSRPRRAHRHARRDEERVRLLGQEIDLVRPEEVMDHIARAVTQRRRTIVANHNLHSLYLVRRDPAMRRFYAMADMVELDSTPLVHFARLLGLSARPFHRCTYLDWRDHFWSLADRQGWRVSYLGGAPGVAENAARRLRARYLGANIQALDGYFDMTGAQNDARLAAIGEFAPDVLFVGMGMPRQEAWIVAAHDRLPACPVLSVGAAFDYEAGAQKAAPRWMGRAGLEWLFRLVSDPRRLFIRYCVEPWFLLAPAVADLRAARRG